MGVFRKPVSARRSAKRFKPTGKYKARATAARAMSGSDSSYRSVIPRIRNPDYGFPDKMVTRLRYVDTFALTGAVGVPGANTFRANSLFDPDLSGLGHQPMYFDQICGPVGTAPYSKYRVISSKITVKFTVATAPATAAANVGPFVVGLQSSATSGLYGTSASNLCEASGSVWTNLGDKSGGNNVKTLTATYIPNRDLGLDVGDDTIAAAYNANPFKAFHFIPWKIDQVGSGVVNALVQLEFVCEFMERNEVAQS